MITLPGYLFDSSIFLRFCFSSGSAGGILIVFKVLLLDFLAYFFESSPENADGKVESFPLLFMKSPRILAPPAFDFKVDIIDFGDWTVFSRDFSVWPIEPETCDWSGSSEYCLLRMY